MTKFVFDSWAWMEYLDASKKGEAIKAIIENQHNEIYSSAVSLAEVVSKCIRTSRNSDLAFQAINSLSKVVLIDEHLAAEAGRIHADFRKSIIGFGLADAFVIATAARVRGRIVTGDPHFKKVKGAMLL